MGNRPSVGGDTKVAVRKVDVYLRERDGEDIKSIKIIFTKLAAHELQHCLNEISTLLGKYWLFSICITFPYVYVADDRVREVVLARLPKDAKVRDETTSVRLRCRDISESDLAELKSFMDELIGGIGNIPSRNGIELVTDIDFDDPDNAFSEASLLNEMNAHSDIYGMVPEFVCDTSDTNEKSNK